MGTGYVLKGKAKNLLAKWLDIDQSSNAPSSSSSSPSSTTTTTTTYASSRPPAVPPKGPRRQSQPHSQTHSLEQSFDGLTVSNSRPRLGAGFIGGFGAGTSEQKSTLMPMPMPQPSLTMQYALSDTLSPGGPPSRPYSAPSFPVPHTHPGTPVSDVSPSPTGPRPQPPAVPSLKPPRRPRASSTPPTPTDTASSSTTSVNGQIQCSGVTKAGKRCTRLVKTGPPLSQMFGAANPIERFCFQHVKELLGPSGFYARKAQQGAGAPEWIEFVDYIPPYLHPSTQVALRVEMEKARSLSDVEGYIYTFEIRDSAPDHPSPPPGSRSRAQQTQKTISFKVGRTTNVVKRIHQWSKQCGSKEQVLRGWFPGVIDTEEDEEDAIGHSLMRGRVRAGGKGVWCHRLERLIHLELADLAVNGAYLEPGWRPFTKGQGKGRDQLVNYPSTGTGPSTISHANSSSSSVSAGAAGDRSKKDSFLANGLGNGGGGGPCEDCGQIHKEIFEFRRVTKGPYKGLEWEAVVNKVVEEWGCFVRDYL